MTKSLPTHTDLLLHLKSIVLSLHRCPGDPLRRQYGALQRLRSSILAILIDGLKRLDERQSNTTSIDVYGRCWQLIIALNKHSEKFLQLLQDVYQQGNNQTSVEQWIEQSILRQCLTEQFQSELLVLEEFYTSKSARHQLLVLLFIHRLTNVRTKILREMMSTIRNKVEITALTKDKKSCGSSSASLIERR